MIYKPDFSLLVADCCDVDRNFVKARVLEYLASFPHITDFRFHETRFTDEALEILQNAYSASHPIDLLVFTANFCAPKKESVSGLSRLFVPIRDSDYRVPAICYDYQRYRENALEAGVDAFVAKEKYSELSDAIAYVLSGEITHKQTEEPVLQEA